MIYCVMFPFWCSGGGGSHVSTTDREETLADTKFRGDAVGTRDVSEKENVLYILLYMYKLISLTPGPFHLPVFDCLQFCIPKAIKNWSVGRPGNEATISYKLADLRRYWYMHTHEHASNY